MLNMLNLFLLYKQLIDPVNLLVPPTVSLALNCHDSVNLQRNYFNYLSFLSFHLLLGCPSLLRKEQSYPPPAPLRQSGIFHVKLSFHLPNHTESALLSAARLISAGRLQVQGKAGPSLFSAREEEHVVSFV